MASSKLAFLAIAVLLLQASWCAVSQSQTQHYATMVWTSFGEDGSNGPAACDGKYHDDRNPLAAVSPEGYGDGSRCFRLIQITSKDTGKTTRAMVVDEVDQSNMVAASSYVWELLGFDDHNIGEVVVSWGDI